MANKQNSSYNGYQWTKIDTDSPYYPMSHNGSIVRHRLVMAQHLGRCLKPGEIVHHLNKRKQDNRIENLYLLNSGGTHTSIHKILANALTEIDEEAYRNSSESKSSRSEINISESKHSQS